MALGCLLAGLLAGVVAGRLWALWKTQREQRREDALMSAWIDSHYPF